MAILDTFYLLFKSDASDLKKGIQEVETVIKRFADVVKIAIPTGFLSAGINRAIDFGIELSRTSQLLNVNAKEFQSWRNAVELAGGDANQFSSTLSSLATKFNTSSETVLKLLPRYADILSKLSPQRAQQVGKNILGLDESTILLLQRGRSEVDAIIRKQKEQIIITQKDTEQYLKYNRTLTETKQATQNLFSIIALTALPYLIRFQETLNKGIDYLIQHKEAVIGGIYAISAAVTVLGIRFALASLPLTLMTGLVVGIIALFAILYEDVQAFLNGQKSFLGYLTNQYPIVGEVVRAAFDTMSKAIQAVLHPIETLKAALEKIKNLWHDITSGKKFDPLKPIPGIKDPFNAAVAQRLQQNAALQGGTNQNTTSVQVGDVTIHTQATDAKGISGSFKDELSQQLAQLSNYHADGVMG